MRATYMFGAGDVRVIEVSDPTIQQPGDALVRVVRACVCGSDLVIARVRSGLGRSGERPCQYLEQP